MLYFLFIRKSMVSCSYLFQFFLTLAAELDYLDGVHTVFGEVSEGFDTLTKLNETIVDEEKRPYQDVR